MLKCAAWYYALTTHVLKQQTSARILRIIPNSMDGHGKVASWAECGKGCTGERNKFYY